MNNSITELVLIESRSARNNQISDVSDEHALETLNKAKALVMAVWQGIGIATNAQLAEYFGVGIGAIESVLRRNRDELLEDGVKVLKGKDLKDVSVSLTETGSRTRSSLTIWTPRATLRLGMLLQDSPVAKELRSVILDVVESANPIDPDEEDSESVEMFDFDDRTMELIEAWVYYRKLPSLEAAWEEYNHPDNPLEGFASPAEAATLDDRYKAISDLAWEYLSGLWILDNQVLSVEGVEKVANRFLTPENQSAAVKFQLELDQTRLEPAPTQKQLA